MITTSDTHGTVFFVRWSTGFVCHLKIPKCLHIAKLEREMRKEYDRAAAAGGSSVRRALTEVLDDALNEPRGGPDLDGVIAAAGLGLLRLYGVQHLAIVDRGDHYEYVPIADGEDAARSMQIYGSRVGRPAANRSLH